MTKPNGSGPIPKGKNQALTDNVRVQSTRTRPPDVDPKGVNTQRPQSNKKTTIKSKQNSD